MRILIIQTSFLGDVILTTPVIAALKQIYPQAELYFMTTPRARELLVCDPLISGILVFDKHASERGLLGIWRKAKELRGYRFEQAFALSRSFRTSLLMFFSRIPIRTGFEQAWLKHVYHTVKPRDSKQHDVLRNLGILPDVDLSQKHALRLFCPEWQELPDALRQEVSPGAFVIIVPGSAKPTKMWHWEKYREVVDHFLGRGVRAVLLGSDMDQDVCNKITRPGVINLAGKTNLSQAMTLVKNSAMVICNDSMTQHMAAAFQVPNVVVFCATSPEFGFGPWQNRAIVVEKQGLSCKPCSRHGGTYCPTGTHACMRELESSQVIAAAQVIWPVETARKIS